MCESRKFAPHFPTSCRACQPPVAGVMVSPVHILTLPRLYVMFGTSSPCFFLSFMWVCLSRRAVDPLLSSETRLRNDFVEFLSPGLLRYIRHPFHLFASFYSSWQVQLLQAELKPSYPSLEINTIDKYQGRDKKVLMACQCIEYRSLPVLFVYMRKGLS